GVPSGGPRSHPGGVGRRRGPGRGEPGGEQGGALALGESLLARAAGEHPPLVLAVAEADPEVAFITQAVVGAIRVLTTKQGKVFHEATPTQQAIKSVGNSLPRL